MHSLQISRFSSAISTSSTHINRNLAGMISSFPLRGYFSFILLLSCFNVFLCARCIQHHSSSEDEFHTDNFQSSGDVYHSPKVFQLSYAEMERDFKVYIYSGTLDDDSSLHRSILGKYASEGYFFQNVEASKFRTYDPDRAHLFFVPISCHQLRREGKSLEDIRHIFQDYVESLISKYPHWNRTLGADHFFVSCHDAGLKTTEGVPLMVKNAIRVVCSAGYNGGYTPHKDVSLLQVIEPSTQADVDDIKKRRILGFWGGKQNSKIRNTLVRLWKNDSELDIQNNAMKEKLYQAKFCICPGDLQANNARLFTSIHSGCVPVILSNHYDLPFSGILDWRKFSVIINERDVHQLKCILKNISEEDYIALHSNLLKVQKHFQWNSHPVRYDAFHMVMYELWLRHYLVKY